MRAPHDAQLFRGQNRSYGRFMAETGRCLCGKVSYPFEGDPIATTVCHGSHRQRGKREKDDQVCVRRRF